MSTFGLIILAAGGSTRMGRAKQLIEYRGQTLLRRAAETALAAGCGPVVAVLGAEVERCRATLHRLPVDPVVNDDWQRGMGKSLRRGLAALRALAPDLAGAIVMLCDQPHVTAGDVRALVDAHQASGKPVCAATFDDTVGPPCLFAASYFPNLMGIADAAGAKPILLAAGNDLLRVPLPGAATDVDTPADAELLNER